MGISWWLDDKEKKAPMMPHTRILYELTTLNNIYLEQLKAFTNPNRVLDST